jgi:hippurate hydrolase
MPLPIEELVELRHDLHRHPELGYAEFRTHDVVCDRLRAMGVQLRANMAGGTGVVGHLPATQSGGGCIALRADMDALPITEQTGLPYASQNPGAMHACGHDGHTTILLGAAHELSEMERPHDILFMFQPAEEGGAGAAKLVDEGALDGGYFPKADLVYGLHGVPHWPVGHLSTRVGPLMAAATQFRITIRGRGTHAAYPHWGRDPIVGLAHIITGLQTVASRLVSPLTPVVVTVGKIEAGVAHNVVPETAVLHGTVRALDDATDILARSAVDRIVSQTAQAHELTAEIDWIGAYPVVVNHPTATDRFFEIVEAELEPEPSMGGEDFAFYGRVAPACFFFLGLRPEEATSFPNLHAPTFDFNDDAIVPGIKAMVDLATAPL